MTRAIPMAAALLAVDHSAANPLRLEPSRPGFSGLAAILLLGGQALLGQPHAVPLAGGRRRPHAIERAAIVSLGGALRAAHGCPVHLAAHQPGRHADQVAAGGGSAVSEEPPTGREWWAALAVGGAIGLFCPAGLLADADKAMPAVWFVWPVGLLLAHDLLLEPVVHLADRWVRRAPEVWRWPLQIGMVGSVVLALASVLALAAVRHLRAQGWALRIRAP